MDMAPWRCTRTFQRQVSLGSRYDGGTHLSLGLLWDKAACGTKTYLDDLLNLWESQCVYRLPVSKIGRFDRHVSLWADDCRKVGMAGIPTYTEKDGDQARAYLDASQLRS